MSTTDIVLIIGVLTTSVVTILNAVRGKVADGKLDHITTLTNSTLTAANARNVALEEMIATLLTERGALERQVQEMRTSVEAALTKVPAPASPPP